MINLATVNNIKNIDDIIFKFVDKSIVTDTSVNYPDLEKLKKNDKVTSNLFIDAINSNKTASERNAIAQYLYGSGYLEGKDDKSDTYSKLGMSIGIIEMYHYHKLTEAVYKLTDKIPNINKWDTSHVLFGKDLNQIIQYDIQGEEEAIRDYNVLLEKLQKIKSDSSKIVYDLIYKIIKDEIFHLNLLNNVVKTI